MRTLAAFVFVIFAVGIWGGGAHAQAVPSYLDPGAREIVPNLGPVPTIRFLTTADFPPFNFRDKSGTLVGFNIDLARAICTAMAIPCTIQAWPWAQAVKALQDNQGDALIAGLAINRKNGQKLDFSSLYLSFPARFVTPVSAVSGFAPSELVGKTVAVRKGTHHAEFMKRYLPNVKLSLFDTEFDALDAVRSGTADAYFGDAMRASFWLNDNPGCCAFAGKPYFKPDLFGDGMAIAVPAGHPAIRQFINAGLARLERKGTMTDLYLRWFPMSFY